MEKINPKVSDLKKFLEEKKSGFDLTLIEFSRLYEVINQSLELAQKLTDPGIAGVFCLATNKIYIHSCIHVLGDLDADYIELTEDVFESPRNLVKDFAKYGVENFVFIVFTFGEECLVYYKDHKIKEKELERIKSMWPYQLY